MVRRVRHFAGALGGALFNDPRPALRPSDAMACPARNKIQAGDRSKAQLGSDQGWVRTRTGRLKRYDRLAAPVKQ